MSKSILTAEIDMVSLTRQLTKAAKGYKEGQEQAIKRWGVQTCRELAASTVPFGKTGKSKNVLKSAMLGDAYNVLITHKGRAVNKSASVMYMSSGKRRYVRQDLYLKSIGEIDSWIERHRTTGKKRTRRLDVTQRAVCTQAKLNRVINQRLREKGGTAKDGWIDAGNSIARGQKGKSPSKIGVNFIKWASKSKVNGRSKEGSRNFQSFGELINDVEYVKSSYMLSLSKKKRAIVYGAKNTLKWYQRTMRAEAKKKRK